MLVKKDLSKTTNRKSVESCPSKLNTAVFEHAQKFSIGKISDILELIKKNLSINIYEAKIWTALLSRGIANASQLADISGVPRSRCYDVLETLEKKGFIITKLGKPIKYIAISPEEVIKRVKKAIDEEANSKVRFVDSIKQTDIFRELELLHKSSIDKVGIEEISDFIIGRNNIKRQIKEMVNNANKSITIVTTEDGFKWKSKLLKSVFYKLNKKGVKINVGVATNKDIKMNNGLKIKKVKTNARFISIDDKSALFMIADHDISPDSDTGILVKSEFFTKAFDGMFKANMQ